MTDTVARKKRERFTVQLPVELIERARNTVYWSPGMTLARLVEDGLRRVLDEEAAKRGEPFPERDGPLKAGRPVRDPRYIHQSYIEIFLEDSGTEKPDELLKAASTIGDVTHTGARSEGDSLIFYYDVLLDQDRVRQFQERIEGAGYKVTDVKWANPV